jgi:hypothetical protein
MQFNSKPSNNITRKVSKKTTKGYSYVNPLTLKIGILLEKMKSVDARGILHVSHTQNMLVFWSHHLKRNASEIKNKSKNGINMTRIHRGKKKL